MQLHDLYGTHGLLDLQDIKRDIISTNVNTPSVSHIYYKKRISRALLININIYDMRDRHIPTAKRL